MAMKRSPLNRKTPLRSKNPLKSRSSPSRKSQLAARSQKSLDLDECREAVRRVVLARDRGCVIRRLDPVHHRCIGGEDVHELRKRSQGGDICDPFNCVTTCAVGNRNHIEDYPDWAHAIGLVCRAGDTLEDCRLRREAAMRGEVDLSDVRCPAGT